MTSEQQIIAAQAAEIERLKNKVASLEDQLYWLCELPLFRTARN